MSQYFDKTFWKFLLGFIAIVAMSCILIIGTRLYEISLQTKPAAQASVTE